MFLKLYKCLRLTGPQEDYLLPTELHPKYTHLAGDGGEVLLLVHQHQVLEGAWLGEEISLQGHGRGQFWLFIIISKMGYLVKVTSRERREETMNTPIHTEEQDDKDGCLSNVWY